MQGEALIRWVVVLVFAAVIATSLASPSMEDEDGLEELDDYNNNLERVIQQAEEKRGSRMYTPIRRSCIRRGGNCDHQHENCCYNSTCRCNLWGSNCRCQRMGIFQKWGK